MTCVIWLMVVCCFLVLDGFALVDTVDRRHPAPVGMVNIPIIYDGFHTCWVVFSPDF